jgi:hypothetical protein
MSKVPKCKECEHRVKKQSIVTYATYHQCDAENNKTIVYHDRDLPKTSPSWCPLREVKGDQNANKI